MQNAECRMQNWTRSHSSFDAMNALPLILFFLACIAIGYRYYSAFLAAKVMALDDTRTTPAHRFADGQNYVPTNKWVLFGHHFAAISGAGPLIGPVLAAQFGYLPGLLWLAFGVVLAGATHDFVILASSVRRNGKSLAAIARGEISPLAAFMAMLAILSVVVIALAGPGRAAGAGPVARRCGGWRGGGSLSLSY